jgi:hypothetical protein
MNTKLAINIREGTVEVEGDEAFVRSIYQDFKEHIGKLVALQPAAPRALAVAPDHPAITDESAAQSKKKPHRRGSSKAGENSRSADYKPTFDGSIDLSGLEEMYDEFDPENHSEKILLFAIFLRDTVKRVPCTADHIFTCYFTLKAKTETPAAFLQAFRTAQSRTHYIEYSSPQDIQITIPGDNFYNAKLKKKSETTR